MRNVRKSLQLHKESVDGNANNAGGWGFGMVLLFLLGLLSRVEALEKTVAKIREHLKLPPEE